MKPCNVCRNSKSQTLMNNQLVCFRCDELLFDLEIESDEAEVLTIPKAKPVKSDQPVRKPLK